MNKPTVLVVDNGHDQQTAMARIVAEAGYEPLICDAGTALGHLQRSRPYAVVVGLDPTNAAWEFVRQAREASQTPIVVCGSEATNEILHRCFDVRVHGFLLSPFTKDDLARRLDSAGDGDRSAHELQRYDRDGLRIDWSNCDVSLDGQSVELTRTEFRLLKYLIEHEGRVLSHDQILSEVWGPEYQGERDRVKLYVWYLRRKIEADPCRPDLIVTKRGYGYSFVG